MKKFEGVQFEILNSIDKNQLVSAGAGSGKTTVMIEKISNLILNDGVDIESLLVVTFTVLAAGEMKDRLIAKFEEEIASASDERKTHLTELIEKVKIASIDTIDGFSSKTIKKYFYELEISPNIEIISDATREYFLSSAINSTLNAYAEDEKLNIMLDLFGGNKRNLLPIKELILSTYEKVINIGDYEKFLQDSLKQYEDPIICENIINLHIANKVEKLRKEIMESYSMFDTNVQTKLSGLIEQLGGLDLRIMFATNLKTLRQISQPEFERKEISSNEGLKDLNKQISEFFEFKQELEKNIIDDEFLEKNQKIIEYLTIFLEILNKFIKNYNKIKEKNNLIDFNDLNRLMLKLLKNDKIKQDLQNKYKYIFVDEYQDVNPLQDELISSLVGENSKLFTVGDVKQSIYGFRGASPEWFLKKYNSIKTQQVEGSAFDMNVNFRSNPKILEFINETFSKLMTVKSSGIDFLKDAKIEPKREDIVDGKVEIMLVPSSSEQTVAQGVYSVKNHSVEPEIDEKVSEAMMVANLITNLVGTEFYDAKSKRNRIMTYGDISVLTRSDVDEHIQILVEKLQECGIPVSSSSKLQLDKCEAVKLIMSILKCVTNIADDVDYLAAFMALTDLDIDDVVELRNKDKSFYENLLDNIDNEQVSVGFAVLEKIKQNSYVKSNSDLIKSILNEQKIKYFILRKENGEKQLKLLEKFVNNLTPLENDLSLCEFIEVVESSAGKNGKVENVDADNSVIIQTIHKSKGLEYPVVILYNSSKILSFTREHESIAFNADIGLGVDYFDTANRQKSNGVVKYAIKLKNFEKGYKEELRLLYVALTRAKNKLYITGNYSKTLLKEKEFKHNCFMNMLLSCYKDKLENGENNFEYCNITFLEEVEVLNEHRQISFVGCEQKDTAFSYPNKEKFVIPLKNTVTGLNSEQVQQSKFETKAVIDCGFQHSNLEDKALVGTHYHAALEKLDFNTPFVQTTNFEDVDYKKIKKAHEIISKLTKNAIKIKKEAEFMMYVPHSMVVEGGVQDKILIQGVVDLLIEEDDGFVIVDYKFSSLPIHALKQKYAEQLALYKQAVELAFNKKVKQTIIYSINTGEML